MNWLAVLVWLIVTTSLVSAHMTMMFPMSRSHPLAVRAFNVSKKEVDSKCILGPLNQGKNPPGCTFKELNFPCGGYKPNKKIVTKVVAGQVFNVSFFNQNFEDSIFFDETIQGFFVDKELFEAKHGKDNQARHNGGLIEFALSYDGGKTYTRIATYHRTGPDMAYNWTVKIPTNAPTCKEGVNDKKFGDCIFAWNWLSNITSEFYQNCADIELTGNATTPLDTIDITRANLPGVFNTTLKVPGVLSKCASDELEVGPPGEGKAVCNAEGPGPLQGDIDSNLGSSSLGSDPFSGVRRICGGCHRTQHFQTKIKKKKQCLGCPRAQPLQRKQSYLYGIKRRQCPGCSRVF